MRATTGIMNALNKEAILYLHNELCKYVEKKEEVSWLEEEKRKKKKKRERRERRRRVNGGD